MYTVKFQQAVNLIATILNTQNLPPSVKEQTLEEHIDTEQKAYQFLKDYGYRYDSWKGQWNKPEGK